MICVNVYGEREQTTGNRNSNSNFPHAKAKKNATGQGKETKKVA
jgi:hypothetical protein